jgi:hypothetical protein
MEFFSNDEMRFDFKNLNLKMYGSVFASADAGWRGTSGLECYCVQYMYV